jgi:formate--tetrahydrofolate ligase
VFDDDVADDLEEIEAYTREQHVRVARSHGFELGGQGALALADTLLDALKEPAPTLKYLYELDAPLVDKIRSIACSLYGALDVRFTDQAWAELERAVKNGHGGLPVCIAKTPLSFSDDPKAGGLAQGFVPRVSEVRVSAGAGFVVALMGDVSTMPGLPREPAANRVRIDEQGRAHGLMQGD